MLIMGITLRSNINFMLNINIRNFAFTLKIRSKILCDHLLWTQKYRNLFNQNIFVQYLKYFERCWLRSQSSGKLCRADLYLHVILRRLKLGVTGLT